MADEVSKHILDYEVKGVQAVAAGTAKIEQSVTQLDRATKSATTSADQAAKALKRASEGGAARAFESASDAAADVRQEFSALERKAFDFNRAIAQAALEAGVDLDQLIETGEGLEKVLDRLADKSRNVSRGNKPLSDQVGGLERPVRDVSQLIGGLGGGNLLGGANTGADILGAVEGVGRMKKALPALATELGTSTAALGALGIGVVGLGVAVGLLKKQMDESAAAAQAYLGYEEQYWQLRTTGTTEDARARQEELVTQRQVLENRKKEIEFILAEADATEGVVGAGIDLQKNANKVLDVFNTIAGTDRQFNYGGFSDLNKELEDINKQLPTVSLEYDRLGSDLEAGAFAANDMRMAEQSLADERAKAVAQLIEEGRGQKENQITIATRASEWSSEQIQDRLDQIEIAKKAEADYQDWLVARFNMGRMSLGEFNAEMDKSNKNYLALTNEAAALNEVIAPLAAAREQEAKAVEGLVNVLTKGTGAFASSAADFAKTIETAQKMADVTAKFRAATDAEEAKRNLTTEREAADFARKRAADQAKQNNDLAALDTKYREDQAKVLEQMGEADTEAGQARIDALKEHNKEDLRLATDHQRKILDIQRQMSKGVEDAVLARDVSAAIAAMERGKEASDTENQQYADEAERRDQDFKDRIDELDDQRQEKIKAGRKQLDDLRAQHDAERAAKITAFNQQMIQEDQERRIRLQRLQQDWAIEDAARQAQYTEQLNALHNANTNERTVRNAHYKTMIDDVTSFGKTVTGIFGAALRGVTPTPTTTTTAAGKFGSTTPYTGKGSFAEGGFPPPGTVVDINERRPESAMFLGNWQVFPHQNMKTLGALGGGPQVSLNLQGAVFGEGVSAASIRSVFEADILPRVVDAVQQASRGGNNASLRL